MHSMLGASRVLIALLVFFFFAAAVHGKDDFAQPKEFGVYIKTNKGFKRLLPNMVFDEGGLLYIEMNNPARFPLKDVESLVIYGKYDLSVFTLNPLLFFKPSPVGKHRYIFGKEITCDVKKRADGLFIVKPKDLLGRGYMAVWINDTAWDFIIE